jgi:hypothetical protein
VWSRSSQRCDGVHTTEKLFPIVPREVSGQPRFIVPFISLAGRQAEQTVPKPALSLFGAERCLHPPPPCCSHDCGCRHPRAGSSSRDDRTFMMSRLAGSPSAGHQCPLISIALKFSWFPVAGSLASQMLWARVICFLLLTGGAIAQTGGGGLRGSVSPANTTRWEMSWIPQGSFNPILGKGTACLLLYCPVYRVSAPLQPGHSLLTPTVPSAATVPPNRVPPSA